MKIGIRKPNLKKSIKARTTGKLKRQIKSSMNPLYGEKGVGFIKEPKRAIYNKVYNKTTITTLGSPHKANKAEQVASTPKLNNHSSLSKLRKFYLIIGIVNVFTVILGFAMGESTLGFIMLLIAIFNIHSYYRAKR